MIKESFLFYQSVYLRVFAFSGSITFFYKEQKKNQWTTFSFSKKKRYFHFINFQYQNFREILIAKRMHNKSCTESKIS